MALSPDSGLQAGQYAFWFKLMVDVALKSTLVAGFFGAAAFFSRRASAAFRSRIWLLALVVLAALPVASVTFEVGSLHIIPDFTGSRATLSESDLSGSETPATAPAGAALERPAEDGAGKVKRFFSALLPAEPGWTNVVVTVWLFGALLLTGWVTVCQAAGAMLRLKARPLGDRSWQALVRTIADRLAVRKQIHVKVTNRVSVAMTCGTVHPTIILPASSREWNHERRTVVLTHEIAHIQRLDSFFDHLSKVVMVLYWFQPLVWVVVRQLRVERERACDDVVLNTGTRPSSYATQLMEVAAFLGNARERLAQVVTITEGSSLKDRLLRILDPKVNRKLEKGIVTAVLTLVTVAVMAPLSSMQVWSPSASTKGCPLCQDKDGLGRVFAGLSSSRVEARDSAVNYLAKANRVRMPEILAVALRQPAAEARTTAVDILAKRDQYRVQAILKNFCCKSRYPDLCVAAKAELDRIGKKKASGLNAQLNSLGYKMLKAGNNAGAIEVFLMNAKAFPESSNAVDSLAEAYLVQGEYPKARELYRKSLEMNPDNLNAVKMLQRMDETEKQASAKP